MAAVFDVATYAMERTFAGVGSEFLLIFHGIQYALERTCFSTVIFVGYVWPIFVLGLLGVSAVYGIFLSLRNWLRFVRRVYEASVNKQAQVLLVALVAALVTRYLWETWHQRLVWFLLIGILVELWISVSEIIFQVSTSAKNMASIVDFVLADRLKRGGTHLWHCQYLLRVTARTW